MTTSQNTSLTLWNDQSSVQEIKKLYAPNLNENEFKIFLNIGKSTGLNPFLREIWAVKYGQNAASIFIGRDGYRKAAQSNEDYDYHIADAVYSKDEFKVEDGAVKHSYSLNGRGDLVGAYCTVKRKSSSKPNFVYVELKEYNTNQSLWAKKPATMIKKVAEAQGLRMTFQELFAGTYEEAENWQKPIVNEQTGEVIEKQPEVIQSEVVENKPARKVKVNFEAGDRLSTGISSRGKNIGKPWYAIDKANGERQFIREDQYEYLYDQTSGKELIKAEEVAQTMGGNVLDDGAPPPSIEDLPF